jgi:hypothetical protein
MATAIMTAKGWNEASEGRLLLQCMSLKLADAVEKGKNELTESLTCVPVETGIS